MSILQLLNVNQLNNTYEHTIDFQDLETQTAYFDSKVYSSIELPEDDYVYIRENRTIEVDKNKQELLGVNYLRFNNKSKWWYAFITNKTYINENLTSIEFEIDVMQTFMFDYQINESYVIREHQNRWINKDNTLYPQYNYQPENINLGTDYKVEKTETIIDNNFMSDLIWVEVVCTEPISNQTTEGNNINYSYTLNVNGVNTGVYCYLLPFNKNKFFDRWKTYQQSGGTGSLIFFNQSDILPNISISTALLSLRILPYSPIQIKEFYQDSEGAYVISFEEGIRPVSASNTNFGGVDMSRYGGFYLCLENVNDSNIFSPLTKIEVETSDNYNQFSIPDIKRESKLKTFPYSYINLTNFQDEGFKFKREFIDDTSKTNSIKIKSSLGVLSKTAIWVDNYLNDSEGRFHLAINNTISELPQRNSAYISYLANNKATATTGFAVNTGIDIATNLIRTGVGVATSNPFAVSNAISGVSSIATNIINYNIKMQDLKDTPDSISKFGNNGEFDVFKNNIKYYMCFLELPDIIKKITYNYFYHFGYACKDFKVPDLRSRYYFNYIEIANVSITSDIDNEYIQRIKQIYNNGITLWHYRSADTFRGIDDYTYENAEMTLIGE